MSLPPRLKTNDALDLANGYAKLICKFAVWFTGSMSSTNLAYLYLIQDRSSVQLPNMTKSSSARSFILAIFSICTQVKMIGVTAWRVITGMENESTRPNRSKGQFKSNSMRTKSNSFMSCAIPESKQLTVIFFPWKTAALPFPAFIRPLPLNFRPKPFRQRFSHVLIIGGVFPS